MCIWVFGDLRCLSIVCDLVSKVIFVSITTLNLMLLEKHPDNLIPLFQPNNICLKPEECLVAYFGTFLKV